MKVLDPPKPCGESSKRLSQSIKDRSQVLARNIHQFSTQGIESLIRLKSCLYKNTYWAIHQVKVSHGETKEH